MRVAVRRARREGRDAGMTATADALVIFGITGDLAKSDLPVAVPAGARAGCSTARSSAWRSRLVGRRICASTRRRASRRRARTSTTRCSRASPAPAPTSRATSATRRRSSASRDAIGDAKHAGVLPRDPAVPVRRGRREPRQARADRRTRASSSRSRSATTSPRRARSTPSCTATSTSPSSSASTTSSARWAWTRSSTCASPTRCSSRSGTGCYVASVQITMAENFGVEDRGSFYDPVGALRDVVRQPPPAGGRGDGDGAARAAAIPRRCKDGIDTVFRVDAAPRTRRTTCAGSTTATSGRPGSRPRARPPRPTRRCSCAIDNWRWYGVPFFIRAGKHLPCTRDRGAPRVQARRRGSASSRAATTRRRTSSSCASTRRPACARSSTRAAPSTPTRSRSRSTWSSRDEGGEGATPYEVLLEAAMAGDTLRFARQDSVEESWRVMQPLLDAPPPVHAYAPGDVGPEGGRGARRRSRHVVRTVDEVDQASSAAVGSPFPPIADYAFLSDCHTGRARRAGRVDRLALRAALRLPQRVRQPARPRGGQLPASRRSG